MTEDAHSILRCEERFMTRKECSLMMESIERDIKVLWNNIKLAVTLSTSLILGFIAILELILRG